MSNTDLLLKDNISKYIFDYASEVIFIFDHEQRIVETNRTFNILFGYSKDELAGKSVTDLVFKEDWGQFGSIDKLSDELNVFVTRFISKEKREFWFELKVRKVEGNLYLAVGRDISRQKETEERLLSRNRELEEERARTKAMLENIGDGVIGLKDMGEITYINGQVEKLLGFRQDELLGKLITKAIRMVNTKGEEIPINERPVHESLFNKKKVTDSKHSYLKKDGEVLPVSITATPITVGGFVMGGVVVFRDITKEREIDRMKTEFLSLASHQLRTPLSATKWFVELILDDCDNLTGEQKEMMQSVFQSNERMIQLVNSLLNITRIESGRIIIEPKMTNLTELVNSVVEEIQPKLNKKSHHLAININLDVPEISIDPKLIRHVYLNLLTNAVKYTRDSGEIKVAISKTGEEIISEISDNGYGIPDSQQKRIFQKFFRADNVIKVETDGSGLGLYLAKSIVEASNGRMWFESKEGEGTTFWFSLPVAGTPPKEGEVSVDA